MAKFFHILAASVGGGLILGAGIRLGEAICSPAGASQGRSERRLRNRINRLEEQVTAVDPASAPDWQTALAGIVERIDRQQDDLAAVQRQISGATRMLDSIGEITSEMCDDLQRDLSGDLERRLAAVEQSLQLSLETANREAANAMLNSIEKKLAPRIERLEKDVSGQAASVAELRDCALQSERSVLRLLTVLEKNMSPVDPELPRLSVVR